MTLKGGTTLACAACKYQRRKCTPKCHLAPYFPADQPKVFLNVHKLFGVSNIVKILKKLDPCQKKIAMESLITQANYRDKYPVHGCWEEICRLRYQIWHMEEELRLVHQQIEICRQQQHDDVTSQLELGMAPCNNNNNTNNDNNNNNTLLQCQYPYSNSNIGMGFNTLYMDYSNKDDNNNKDVMNPLWFQHQYANHNGNGNGNSSMVHTQLVTTEALLPVQQEEVVDEEYDEMHPFFDAIDDRQSFIYSKEAYDSSSEESLRDTRKCIEHVSENELKSAAACFSLTSVS